MTDQRYDTLDAALGTWSSRDDGAPLTELLEIAMNSVTAQMPSAIERH